MRYEKVLNEVFFDAFQYRSVAKGPSYVEIFKNPSVKEYKEVLEAQGYNGVRGVLTIDGDLYVAKGEILHDDLLAILAGKDLDVDDAKDWHMNKEYMQRFICVISEGNNTFEAAESYVQKMSDYFESNYFDEYDYNFRQKNPSFKLKSSSRVRFKL